MNRLVAIAGIGGGAVVFASSASLWLQLQPMVAIGLAESFPINVMLGLSWAGMLLISPLLALVGVVSGLQRD